MMLFGLGKVPAVFATLIYSMPPVIRLTCLGLTQVPPSVQEAALAYGATRWQLLWEVRIPLAMPSIMAGINQTTMMALAMVVISSMIGARGLGQEVLLSINRIDVGRGFESGMSIVIMAIVIDRITQGFARKLQPYKHR
jgi:glycine betaine/proline transport system permease protein